MAVNESNAKTTAMQFCYGLKNKAAKIEHDLVCTGGRHVERMAILGM